MVATSGRGIATRSSQMVAKTRGFKTFCIKYSDVTTWSLSIDHNLWVNN